MPACYHPADGVRVSADELGRALDDDVGAVCECALERRWDEGRVHAEQSPAIMHLRGDPLQIDDAADRVGRGLDMDELCAGSEYTIEIAEVERVEPEDLDPKPGEVFPDQGFRQMAQGVEAAGQLRIAVGGGVMEAAAEGAATGGGVFSYASCCVEVEVDLDTFETRVLHVTTAQDVGKAIHPVLVAGQIEGGTLQGLGWALLEEVRWKDGRVWNHQLTNYIIPTSADAPPIDTIIVEDPYSRGPQGAKGVGELPMDVPAPAVVAAIAHATGIHAGELPVTPERLMRAIADARNGGGD